eukprot:CAMPEP_0201529372 /NCGR_PEP_ID=MMETSP0161_2-20130828/41476_1 /ASSEMBLY_ACC=CAM_ASM_000251 /TAXON_ID=180227 /ORGANISM="Neoparamoeba aestuarina, Strain SoJaBio B1-5/56/2" /LENGTH=196 /DNA_ID=CAMNT_0047931147 /DNA_START=328 /DNA_END=915 /DNA_ORIENTATION=+
MNVLKTQLDITAKHFNEEKGKQEKGEHCLRFVIDANASWKPEDVERFLRDVYPFYRKHMYMLEQPFPVDLLSPSASSTIDKWKQVKEWCTEAGVPIFADESCGTSADIAALGDVVHGVNIKLEKCGGYREALRAVRAAQTQEPTPLLVWIGVMVGSTLNSSLAAQLLPAASFGGDLDGWCLVDPLSDFFEGGFDVD